LVDWLSTLVETNADGFIIVIRSCLRPFAILMLIIELLVCFKVSELLLLKELLLAEVGELHLE
jgi:hypothetical protein